MHGGLSTTIFNIITVDPKAALPPPPSYSYNPTVKKFIISKKLNVFYFDWDVSIDRPYMLAIDTSNVLYLFEIDYKNIAIINF